MTQLEGTDAATEWRAVVGRVRGFVGDAVEHDGAQALELTVPACPDWTARDLLSHMVGVGADTLSGDEADDHNDGWTQAQVDARAERSALEILDEWEALADDLERYIVEQDPRPLGDAIIHEQDLRGALDRPGARDTAGLASVRQTMAARFADAVSDRPPVSFRSDEWVWTTGEGEPGVVLEASGFDLFRALVSRRTAEQLRSYVTAGDVSAYLDAFAQLGDLPEHELPE